MNIEVGEYVRTKEGNIFKIIGGNSDNYDIDCSYYKLEALEDEWFESNRYNDNGYFFNERNIKKHSKNIIDLIEVGDVVKTGVNKSFLHILATEKDLEHFKKVYKNKQDLIKSIVTKEQFNNMEYKL